MFADNAFYYTEGAGTIAAQTKTITYHVVDSSGVQSLTAATYVIHTHPKPTGVPQTHSMRAGQTLCAGTTVSRPPGGATCNLRFNGMLAGAGGDTGPLSVRVISISFASGEYSGVTASDGSFVYKAGAGTAVAQTKIITFQIIDGNFGHSSNITYTIHVNP